MGMGFKKYIDTLKIGKSIEILLTTDSTISNISEHLGFSSSSTSKMFKSYMDITPNEYRNLSKYNKIFNAKARTTSRQNGAKVEKKSY